MKYPKNLLPSKEYVGRIAAEDIPRGACFIRWTAKNLPVKAIQGLRKNAAKHIEKGCIFNGISCYLCSVMKKNEKEFGGSLLPPSVISAFFQTVNISSAVWHAA